MDLHPRQDKSRDIEGTLAEFDPIWRALQDEDWYRDLVEHSHDLLCIHDLDGRLLSVNPAPARVLGYSVGEILQIPMRDLIAPEFREQFDVYMQEIKTAGEAHGLMVVIARSGERHIWKYRNSLRAEGVESPIVRGIAHDVTHQKRIEKLLREANQKLVQKVGESERTIQELRLFRALLDKSNDAIEVVNPDTLRFLDVNETACSQLGYSRGELLSLAVLDIDPAASESSTANVLEQLRKSGSIAMESLHRRKDGSTFPVELCLTRVQLERDYVVAIARDISRRREFETRLQISENRYRAMHDRVPVGICWLDSNTGRFLEVNPAACEIFGRSEKDLLGRDFQSITHPDDLAENCAKLRQLTEGKLRHYEMQKRYIRSDGAIRWADVSIVAMGVEGIRPLCHMAIVKDITEARWSEERLREYERVIEDIEEMFVVIDRDYRYVIANREFLHRRGLSKEQLSRHTVMEQLRSEGMAEESLKEVKEKIDECLRGHVVRYEVTYRYRSLGERDLSLAYFPIEGPQGIDRIACILQDVTPQKRAAESLRRSEENYRMFVAQSSEGIFREDLDAPVPIHLPEDELVHHILHDSYLAECNDALARMYGLTSSREIAGKRLSEMVPPDDPANIELTRQFIRSGFRVMDRESHEVDIHGNPKVFLNSMIGTVENGMLIRTWGIQRDVTEKMKLEEARRKAEEDLRRNVTQLRQVTEELRVAQEKLSEEKLYLEQAIDTELGFGEIIGRSGALTEVMQKVARVAPSDATVLLLGETGTGKELVARALHRLSKRQGKSFIKMNCAAIPSGLLESDLFGHEKGAFTGAVLRKLGRLELADGGTLFLDEVGEIALNLQPKLLRVLQDLEFERLGGTQTLRVNVRLLAATNRDLLQSVKDREFRSDLYYRLNVFPILIPPLRERREDIRPLVEHFVRKFSHQMKKSITSVPSKTMEILVRWDWPGNIRELENFVERSVILTPGSVLQAPLSELQATLEERNKNNGSSWSENEREQILRTLKECRGKLGGPDGAAARLGLKRTTLQSKLDNMGIKPGSYRLEPATRNDNDTTQQ
ncbi:MAG: PAS domain S-box protein [Candidatus Sulfotelmatobacter sp.]